MRLEDQGQIDPKTISKDDMITYDDILNHVGLTYEEFMLFFSIAVVFAGKGSLGLATSIIVAILKKEWNLNTSWTIGITSLYFLGYAFGAAYAYTIGNYFGKPKTLKIMSILTIVDAIAASYTTNVYQFIVTQIILGFLYGGIFTLSGPILVEGVPH